MNLERGFEKVVDACAADTDVFQSLIKLVSDYMRTIWTISANFSRFLMQQDMLALTIRTNSNLQFSIISTKIQRGDRGFHRPWKMTDYSILIPKINVAFVILIPQTFFVLSNYNEDPMYATVSFGLCANFFFSSGFMNQVEDAMIEITSKDLPSFLYETGTVYDPENEAAGLFRGFLLVRVSTCLITFHYAHSIFPPGLSAYFYRSCFSNEPKRDRWNKEQGTSLQYQGCHRSDNCLRMHSGKYIFICSLFLYF